MKCTASRKPTYRASNPRWMNWLKAWSAFGKKHSDFHSLLLDGAEHQASEEYFEDVEEKYLHIMDKIKKTTNNQWKENLHLLKSCSESQ